ncbi:MAG: cupin domain-containing protein [Spirochaetales bacterium]|nr:cupin domain-containing protein [Spirochaetales bacterium]
MYIAHRNDIPKKIFTGDAVKGVTKQILVGPEQGWEDYVMRMFTLEKGGYTPRHKHDWPHILYAVEGKGKIFNDGKSYPFEAGTSAFVSPNSEHQISNNGEENFVFICIVPEFGDK